MRFFLFISLFLLPMVSIATEECADCDRHPAFSVPVPAVFRLMDAKLTEKEKQAGACENLVASKLEDTLRESHKAIHDIMDVTEEKTKNNALLETEFTKLKALPPAEALNCSQVEDIRFLAEALSRRFDQVKEKRTTMIPIAASFLEDSAQSDDEGTADKTLCLIKCTREKGLVPNGKDACSNSCSADEKFFKNAEDAVIESSLLSPTCFDVGSGRIERETIMGFFRKLRAFETQLGEEFANSWAKSEPAMAANESDLFKRLSLANKALLLTLGRNCAYEKVVPQVEKASSLVMTPTMFSGTGFYLSSGKSTYFASARHVATGGEMAFDAPLAPVLPRGKPFEEAFEFSKWHREFDVGNDALLKKVKPQKNTLPLVEAGKKPKPGQNFFVAGFPAIRKSEFTVVRCKFLGYGPNWHETSTGYSLYCPAEGSLGGVSGGPMVDEEGKVWGITINHSPEPNMVVVTPLSDGETGKPALGISETFVSDLCQDSLSMNPAPPHRCQIFPGSLDKPIPLPK